MNKENCALKLVDDIILYYDARSKNIKSHTGKSQGLGRVVLSDGPNLPFRTAGNGNHSAERVRIIKSRRVCVDLVKSEI